MPPLPLRAFTQQLRDRWPNEAAALRLRRATRSGKTQYQLIGELPDRTPIGRKLRATTEFDALQEAIDLVPALMNGDGNRGRVMPMGRLKAIERLALQELERKDLRLQSERSRAGWIQRVCSQLEDRQLGLSAASLMVVVRETDPTKRERRSASEAARAVARAAGINLDLSQLQPYQEKKPTLVDVVDDADVLEAYQELKEKSNRIDAHWLVGVVLVTGCRASTALTMKVDGVKDVGDQILAWDSKRNCQIRTTPTVRGFWEKHWLGRLRALDDIELKDVWMPCDRPATDDQILAANMRVNDIFTHVKRKVSSKAAAILKARPLRSAMIARCLRAGMDELTVSTLASTGVEQIRARYARFYKAGSIERAAELL